MIDFIQVEKRFNTQVVLDKTSFRVNAGEHVGLVGLNGSGKSTIFSLISGELLPDSGEVSLPKNVRLGYLHQQLNAYAREDSLIEYAADALPELKSIHAEIQQLEHDLQDQNTPGHNQKLSRLGELQHEYEHLGGYEIRARAEAALSGMGFHEQEFSRPFQSFSGGWQMRAELVRTLIAQPDILMLDEPSNYLDLPAVEWLTRFLRNFSGTMLLISHDRYLLDMLTDRTLEISDGQTTKYAGGYAYYLRERVQRKEQQLAAWRNYEERKAKLESFINRFRAKATKAAQVQSRVKILEKLEVIKRPSSSSDYSCFRMAAPPRCGAHVVHLEDVGFSYDNERWIFKGVNLNILHGQKVALVGYNGMGKTTLLRVLAGALTPGQGTRTLGHKVITGYQSQDFAETMSPNQSVLNIVRAANPAVPEREVRGLLGSFGFSGDAVSKTCSVLSGGEKIRLAFARIFVQPPNFLLLDEPTTHLDIQGREALEEAVKNYEGTVCLVSHDVSFVRSTADHIISVHDGLVKSFTGGYDYFLEKTGVDLSESRATPKASSQATTKDAADSPTRGKDSRKARAKAREAQKGLKDMEKRMENLQKQREVLHLKMASGNEDVDYAALNIELSQVTRALSELESRWLEEADRLGL